MCLHPTAVGKAQICQTSTYDTQLLTLTAIRIARSRTPDQEGRANTGLEAMGNPAIVDPGRLCEAGLENGARLPDRHRGRLPGERASLSERPASGARAFLRHPRSNTACIFRRPAIKAETRDG
jgi:hypothetical protein